MVAGLSQKTHEEAVAIIKPIFAAPKSQWNDPDFIRGYATFVRAMNKAEA